MDPDESLQFPPAETDPAPDPFDPEALRVSQDFAATLGVKRVLTVIKCRKPNRQEFIRVRPGEQWRLETAVFEDAQNRETYLVDPAVRVDLFNETFHCCLFLAINRQNNLFLWPVRLPGRDGRSNPWNDSALAGAQRAERRWIRLAANMPAGLYDTFEASAESSEPEWPDLSMSEILRRAFKDRFIRSLDHPVLKQLRGEV